MNNRLVLFIFILFIYLFEGCSLQQHNTSFNKIEVNTLDTVDIEEVEIPLSVNDYNLSLYTDDNGLYRHKDSTLINAKIKIYLHTFPKVNSSTITDCEKDPICYGYLEGKIINGRKEGKWLKKIKTTKHPHDIIVKVLHYDNGVLNGKYQVYDTNGKALYPIEPHPLFPDEYKNYQIFKNGTGWYYDYYYETKSIKVSGHYKNGKKNGTWI